jgi:hypothetical protein
VTLEIILRNYLVDILRGHIKGSRCVRREEPDLAPVIAPLPESLQQRCTGQFQM